MKRFLSIIITLAIIIGCMPVITAVAATYAAAAEGVSYTNVEPEDGYYFCIDSMEINTVTYPQITWQWTDSFYCSIATLSSAWISTPTDETIAAVGFINVDTGNFYTECTKSFVDETGSLNYVQTNNNGKGIYYNGSCVKQFKRCVFKSMSISTVGAGTYKIAAKLSDGSYIAYNFTLVIKNIAGLKSNEFVGNILRFGDGVNRINGLVDCNKEYAENQTDYFIGAVEQKYAGALEIYGFFTLDKKFYDAEIYTMITGIDGNAATHLNLGKNGRENTNYYVAMGKSSSALDTSLGFHQIVVNLYSDASLTDCIYVFDLAYNVIPDGADTNHPLIAGVQASIRDNVEFTLMLRDFECTAKTQDFSYNLSLNAKEITAIRFAKNCDKFPFTFAAKEIENPVKLSIYYKNVLADEINISVAQYLLMLENNNSLDEKYRTFAEKYLIYAACAQKYFDYNLITTDKKPTWELDSASITEEYDNELISRNSSLGEFYGLSLVLGDTISAKYYFKSGDVFNSIEKNLSVTDFGEALTYCRLVIDKYGDNKEKENLCNLCRAIYDLFNATTAVLNTSNLSQDVIDLYSDVLKIMQFNVKNNTSDSYSNRATALKEIIKEYTPDSIGLQEVVSGMESCLNSITFADNYAGVVTYRADGGEACPIYYRTDKWELVDSGTFWLSDTPDVKGSMFENQNYPRIATWVRLKNKYTGYEYVHINTHLDNNLSSSIENYASLSNATRLKQIQVILEFVATLGDTPVVLTGDFNQARLTSNSNYYPYYKLLIGKTALTIDGESVKFNFGDMRIDSAVTVDEEHTATMVKYYNTTDSAYNPSHQPIDYVFYTKDDFEALEYSAFMPVAKIPLGSEIEISDHLVLYTELKIS